jgi:hypothetical protein
MIRVNRQFLARVMNKVFRTVGSIALAALLLTALALVYSTVKGYTTWYFRVDGQVLVDGRETSGYMHANADRTILLITRTDGTKAETYLVPVADRAAIRDCGDWKLVRFIPNPVKDVNPPCSTLTDSAKASDEPVSSTLVREGRFVSFSTASGKKIKAQW